MRHRKKVKKLNRTASHRKAVLSNLAIAIIDKERIRTTETLAKESKRLVERLITKAKVGTLHARRQVLRVIPDKEIVSKLFDTIAPRYADRHGGYVRLIRIGNRHGDGAALSIVELVGSELRAEEAKKAKPKRKKKEKEPEDVQPVAPATDEPAEPLQEPEASEVVEPVEDEEEEKKKDTTSETEAADETVAEVDDAEESADKDAEEKAPKKEGGKSEGQG